ncbi:MAG: hypothetical protein KAX49_01595 [Halanaerobiales bacterium]|nr:hypothetical protein [Halanaerobiales bacterium]
MPLSSKEFGYVKDHLSWELLMAKKYNDYAQQVTDLQLRQTIKQIGRKHQSNYNTLLNFLS